MIDELEERRRRKQRAAESKPDASPRFEFKLEGERSWIAFFVMLAGLVLLGAGALLYLVVQLTLAVIP